MERRGNGLNDGAERRRMPHSRYIRMVRWLQAESGRAKCPPVSEKGQLNHEKAL
jgi:hypothetical protein